MLLKMLFEKHEKKPILYQIVIDHEKAKKNESYIRWDQKDGLYYY